MKTIVSHEITVLRLLFPRLPLPQMEMTGHWTVNHGSNDSRKLLCPTERHSAEIKVKTERQTQVQSSVCNRFVPTSLVWMWMRTTRDRGVCCLMTLTDLTLWMIFYYHYTCYGNLMSVITCHNLCAVSRAPCSFEFSLTPAPDRKVEL